MRHMFARNTRSSRRVALRLILGWGVHEGVFAFNSVPGRRFPCFQRCGFDIPISGSSQGYYSGGRFNEVWGAKAISNRIPFSHCTSETLSEAQRSDRNSVPVEVKRHLTPLNVLSFDSIVDLVRRPAIQVSIRHGIVCGTAATGDHGLHVP